MVPDNSNRKAYHRDVDGYGQRVDGYRSHTGRSSAANGQAFQESELIELLRRAMAGDGYPLSGGRETAPVQDNQPPLTLLIKDILKNDPPPAPIQPQPWPAYEPQAFIEPPPQPAFHPKPLPAPVTPALQPAVRAVRPKAEPVVEEESAVWSPSLRAIGFVILAALAGGSIPALTATAPEYTAETNLKLVGDAASTPGLLDATTARLTSPHILSQVVARLKLESNPEFNGGGATAYGVAKDIFTDNGGASDNLSRAQEALRERLTVAREPQTGTVHLSVHTQDAAQSVRIVNLLSQVAISDAALSPNAVVSSSSSDTSRKAYDDAMAALDDFKARAGKDKIDAALRLQQQKQDLSRQLERATSEAQAATIRLAAAKAVKVQDVLGGSISPDLGSPAALEDLRNRYASAKSALTMLATQLGPRHPRLLAQQATVDTLSGNIMTEIQKLVGENDSALKQANEQLKQLKNRAAALDTSVVEVDMAQLEKLQTDAEAARSAYENDLSAPMTAASATQAAPLALVAPATEAAASGGSVILSEIYGLLIGAALASFIVFCRLFMRNLTRSPAPARQVNRSQGQPQPRRQQPEMRVPPHPPVEHPQMRFDAEMPVANDRPVYRPAVQAPEPQSRVIDRGVIQARQDVASLRARLETYAAQRPIRR